MTFIKLNFEMLLYREASIYKKRFLEVLCTLQDSADLADIILGLGLIDVEVATFYKQPSEALTGFLARLHGLTRERQVRIVRSVVAGAPTHSHTRTRILRRN